MTENQNHKDVVSLRDFVESELKARDKAADLAADNLKIRLESLNEWRQQNLQERQNFITRSDYQFLLKDIQELKEFRASVNAKASMTSVYVANFFAILGIIIAIIGLIK